MYSAIGIIFSGDGEIFFTVNPDFSDSPVSRAAAAVSRQPVSGFFQRVSALPILLRHSVGSCVKSNVFCIHTELLISGSHLYDLSLWALLMSLNNCIC
jgi:hypothetical protein